MLTNKTDKQLLKLYRQCHTDALKAWAVWNDERCRNGNGMMMLHLPFETIGINGTEQKEEITCQRELGIMSQVLFEREVLQRERTLS